MFASTICADAIWYARLQLTRLRPAAVDIFLRGIVVRDVVQPACANASPVSGWPSRRVGALATTEAVNVERGVWGRLAATSEPLETQRLTPHSRTPRPTT